MRLRDLMGIVIIAALIAGGFSMNNYFKQSSVIDDLNSQISSTNQQLISLTRETGGLKTEIATSTANISQLVYTIGNESKPIPPDKIDSNRIVRDILVLGQQTGVIVVPLSTQDWSSVKTDGNDLQVFKVSLEALGSQENVVLFIRKLEVLYNTLVIGNITLNKVIEIPAATPTPVATPAINNVSTPETATPLPVVKIKADLTAEIYTR